MYVKFGLWDVPEPHGDEVGHLGKVGNVLLHVCLESILPNFFLRKNFFVSAKIFYVSSEKRKNNFGNFFVENQSYKTFSFIRRSEEILKSL